MTKRSGARPSAASEQARELAKADGDSGGGGGGGFFAQARRELASPKSTFGPDQGREGRPSCCRHRGGGHRGGQRSVVEAHHPTQESPHPLGQGSGRTADPHPQRRPAGWATWQRQEATLTAASPRATPTAERSNRMEWVETTGKSLDEAKDEALDRLGIVAEDAEFEVLEEPRTGLFGRTRGVARVRARVRPAAVRPKQDRRGRRRNDGRSEAAGSSRPSAPRTLLPWTAQSRPRHRVVRRAGGARADADEGRRAPSGNGDTQARPTDAGAHMNDDPIDADNRPPVDAEQVEQVKEAAVSFSDGLLRAFRLEDSSSATIDGNEIEVRIDAAGGPGHDGPNGLGLLIGPGGRTLLAIQDLAGVAAQRRLGDHETRLRIDVAGYREKRRIALERFARGVAEMVKESGIARSLDPMPLADRKVIHDALTSIDGVTSRSEGEDPNRRIIVSPA